MIFKHYESCRGISFPSFGNWKLEIWFCKPGYTIREHTHAQEDIKLIFLFGHYVKFHRRKKNEFLGESFLARIKDIGRIFTINAGDAHYFEVSNWPLVFLNIEKWHCKPTSASEDLQLT